MEKKQPNGRSASPCQAFLAHLICGLGLASAIWVSHNVCSVSLISDSSQTLRVIRVIDAPVVILVFSIFRKNPEQCSFWKAIGRGLLGLFAGAVVNALGAIALGEPVGIKYFSKTLNWSLLMSLLTVVPAASVFGSSWTNWQQIFAHTKQVL